MASPRFAFDRALVLVASCAGILTAIVVLALSWPAPDGLFMARLLDSANLLMSILVLVIALLIAWRAGQHAPNMAIALALTTIYVSVVLELLFDRFQVAPRGAQIVQMLLFFVGAAFYIRASQRFPRALSADDIAASPTIWGQALPLRQAATFLLHPAAAWIIAATATVVIVLTANIHVFVPMWMAVTATGIVFFYIALRGPDAESRRKVLWFFEAALAAALTTIAAGAIELTLPDSVSLDTRAVIHLVLNIAGGLVMVVSFAAAVFFAGAISPALIVRKTLVYAATVTALLFVFAVFEIYVAHSVIHALHVNDRFASAVLGAIFGLAFHPVKQRIEHLMKRLAPKGEAGPGTAIAAPR
jgi:hypothetical protein